MPRASDLRSAIVVLLVLLGGASQVRAQSYGVELHNTLMPASGGMAGTSVAEPQDLTSAMNANPATLTQFRGTQFIFGGTWAEPTFNFTQSAPIPLLNVQPYSGKSTAQGGAAANIGITQSLEALDLPVTIGLGFISDAAGFADFRHIPASNRTNSGLMVLEMANSVGVDITERFSLGATVFIGTGIFDGPFVGIGGMTTDYALRGSLGANYQLTDFTRVGAYYQSEQAFRFDNAIEFRGPLAIKRDINLDLPQNVGLGISNTALMDGKLLLAMDVIYKNWDNANLFKTVYNDQWVLQLGMQYSLNNYRLRAGYAYAENPLAATPVGDLGGVFPPGGPVSVRYTQGLLAVGNQHRISFGVGAVDVLPGVNLDLLAGGMFRDTEQLGPSTMTSVASYWVGLGLSWRFGVSPATVSNP